MYIASILYYNPLIGDAPSIRLIIGNTSLHLCYTLLKYIEGCTSNLSMIWSHISSKATDTESKFISLVTTANISYY